MPPARKTQCVNGHNRTPENLTSSGNCVTCARKRTAAWQHNNREQHLANCTAHYQANKKAYYRSNFRRRYGVDEVWFDAKWAAQDGKCDVCRAVLLPGRTTHIDHDHATGKVRGLLCQHCNLMLGHARDNTTYLAAAIEYLQRQ